MIGVAYGDPPHINQSRLIVKQPQHPIGCELEGLERHGFKAPDYVKAHDKAGWNMLALYRDYTHNRTRLSQFNVVIVTWFLVQT